MAVGPGMITSFDSYFALAITHRLDSPAILAWSVFLFRACPRGDSGRIQTFVRGENCALK